MSDDRLQQAEQIFLEALDLPVSDRGAFVRERCADDGELLGMVDAFLEADVAAGDDGFLESNFLAGASLALVSGAQPRPEDEGAETLEPDRRFRILSRYEKGGLGEVLIAEDRQLKREVAVKQIRAKWLGNEEARRRFLQEAEVTGRLEHPGVVPVYAMGTWDDGQPFYAMRFIEGVTLKQAISDHRQSTGSDDGQARQMGLRDLLNRFVDVCNTIEYAHSRRVLHRDIKPSNIMIGPYGETLVVDWGLAKLLDAPFDESVTGALIDSSESGSGSSHTRVGGAVGTPQYMSPEQARGDVDTIGLRTDVYLLGATFYHILTGVPPHDEASVSKLIDRIKSGALLRPRQVDHDIPAPLEAICLRAMHHDPVQRYPSCKQLAADVERWLADQPVTAYRDPVTVRVGRWMRRHRTLAISGALSALLIAIACVAGSALWSYQRAQQLQVETDRNIKEAQLTASRDRRLDEMRESASNALSLSEREILAGRFPAGLSILRTASQTLADESTLQEQLETINRRADRLQRIVDFYHNAELSEQYNAISRDIQGIMASATALKSLGIWDKTDWWAQLPDRDLNPAQRDRLRWDVYQQWLMLDGMLVKRIGTRLFGTDEAGSTIKILSALRRMRSRAGKREATAARVVSDRIDLFRQSEAVRWYRGIANFRLGEGRRVKADELSVAQNAADAQKLGVLCLLSAMDPTFAVVFRDYQGQDSLTAGRDLFQRSASQRPDHYWTQISLGQMQYFIADQDPDATWETYQPAVQTMGRCIAINPQNCFAFADRSSLFRFQSERVRIDRRLSEPERERRAAELLDWSLQDAQTAMRLGVEQPWVGWTYGMALAAAEQRDDAMDAFLEASTRTLPLSEELDATLIRADDIRGRSAAADYALKWMESDPGDSRYPVLLASIRLNQQKFDDALKQVEGVIDRPDAPAQLYAIRGMIRLSEEKFANASSDFDSALLQDPHHVWALYGIAQCKAALGDDAAAIPAFQVAHAAATTPEHRSTCLLGLARSTALNGDYASALEAIRSARAIQPACDVESVARPMLERFRELRDSEESAETGELRAFLESIAELLLESRVEFDQTTEPVPYRVALLNGDFELDSTHYWKDPLGVFWMNAAGDQSEAFITTEQAHRGRAAMKIVGGVVSGESEAADGAGPERRYSQMGSTRQGFSLPANHRCRLSVWAKAQSLGEGAVRLKIDDLAELRLEAGDYGWRYFSVDFHVDDPPDPGLTVVPAELSILSTGPGDVLLDDIEIEVIGN